jgi:putative heme iron utilization protein
MLAGASTTMTETPALTIRRLVRNTPQAALGTLDAQGAPYVSLVLLAVDHDASPLLLLSDLADHTKHFRRDPRVALLVDGTAGMASPLAGARATLTGEIERTNAPHHKARFLARHPDAGGYAGFGDFNFYRLNLRRAHLVAGFGRIHWVEGSDVLLPVDDQLPLRAAEEDILAHMNTDHAAAVELYATRLLGRPAGTWRLTGIDPEGTDLRLGGSVARLWFDHPVRDAESARGALVRLARRARRPDEPTGER